MLSRARALYDELEYDRVIPLTEMSLARSELSPDERLDAYLLQGTCLAIIGDEVGAEKPFRFLLRGRPDFDLPPETPPRALAVFRKVQAEERAFAEQMRALERSRLVKELSLAGDPAGDAKGGAPIRFEYRVRDPRGIVEGVSVKYRHGRQPSYSSLALQRRGDGSWFGEIPGQWTSSADAYVLEYFVVTSDNAGIELLTAGDAATPRTVRVAAGEVDEATPLHRNVWFWGLALAVVIASSVAGFVAIERSRDPPETDLGEFRIR